MSRNHWPKRINAMLRECFGVEIKRFKIEEPVVFSRLGKQWDYSAYETSWIGGRFAVENFSRGYHGILRQWWEHYNPGSSCLLVSENNKVKGQFQSKYPDWTFITLDKYDNLGEPVDINDDLCGKVDPTLVEKFDLIICQATLEHVYDPFAAMLKMTAMLKTAGTLVIHTHTPSFPYHAYPRDYLRFQLDWFHDIPKLI